MESILELLTGANIAFFVAGLVIGIFVVGKLTIEEILKILGTILPHMVKAREMKPAYNLNGKAQKEYVLDEIKKEMSPVKKGLMNLVWGTAGKAVEKVFQKVALPIFKNVNIFK